MDRNKIIPDSDPELKELFRLLYKLKDHFDGAFREELKRSMPFVDLLFDRWDRAKMLGFGEGTSVYDSSHIFGDVKVGNNTWIGPFTILDGSGILRIGNHCSISASVQIYTHDSVNWALEEQPYEYGPTSIGDNCYIGPNSIITRNVTLGNKCLVGANSLVNKSFPAGSRIAGNPAALIG